MSCTRLYELQIFLYSCYIRKARKSLFSFETKYISLNFIDIINVNDYHIFSKNFTLAK